METLQDAADVLVQLERDVEADYEVPFKDSLLERLKTNRSRISEMNEDGYLMVRNGENLRQATDDLLRVLEEDEDDAEQKVLLLQYIQKIERGEFDGKAIFLENVFLQGRSSMKTEENLVDGSSGRRL